MNQVLRLKHHQPSRSTVEMELASKVARLEERIEKLQTTINQQHARYARACRQLQRAKRAS